MALFIICIGLSLTMGLMRVVNLAHGAFAMIAGYIASYAARDLGLGYAVGHPAGDRRHDRRSRSRWSGCCTAASTARRELTQVLMTIGITFCVIGITNYFFGPTLKTIPLPAACAQPVDLGFRPIAAHRLFVMACGVVVAVGLWFLIEKTAFGIKLRATVDNAAMAEALGVRTQVVYAVSFAIAIGLAAFGGVVGAEFLPIEPYYALRYMVTFLVVVSVGGAGSIPGALDRLPCCSARSTRPAAT